MSQIFTGGCACGLVRYEIAADPIVMIDCQCRDCQRESGTGHASHLLFPSANAKLTGALTQWDTAGETGTIKRRAFCPICGAPVHMTFPQQPDLLVVRAGSLDDPNRYNPQMVTWTASAQSWDCIDTNLPSFEKMPPS